MKALRLAAIAVAVLLGACGRAERASVDEETASASAVSEASSCVAQYGGREGDRDVLGVHVGMPLSNADRLLSCHDERLGFGEAPFDVGVPQPRQGYSYVFAQLGDTGPHIPMGMDYEPGEPLPQPIGQRDLPPGMERVSLISIGEGARYTVVGIWREEALAADAIISVDDAVALLIAKYGRPSREQTRASYRGGGVLIGEYGGISGLSRVEGARGMVWLYQNGRLMPGTATARLQQCDEGMYIDPRQGGRMGGTCELMIKAQVIPDADDPNRAARIQVGIFDRAYAERALATERQRREADERQEQVDRANRLRSEGNAPDL